MIGFKWLLFDIGGVLVQFVGAPRILEWMDWRIDAEEMSKQWLFSKAVRAFETGKITSRDFADAVIEEFGFSVNAEEFLESFSYFPKGLYPGAKEFLQELSAKYSIATLSNTNEIHWNRLCCEDNFNTLIKNNFLSFKIGCMKPDKEAYMKVIEELKCKADEIVFFDDNPINVDVARDMGMNSMLVKGFDDLKNRITGLGIL